MLNRPETTQTRPADPAGPVHPQIEEGRRRHAAGDVAGAEAAYRAVLTVDPHHVEALHLLGAVCLQTGRNTEAISLMRAVLAREPMRAGTWQNLVLPLLTLGRVEEAVTAGAEAVRWRPNAVGTWINYTRALVAAGRLQEAVEAAEEGLSIEPATPDLWTALAHVRAEENKPRLAERLLRRALSGNPDHAFALYNLGVVLARQDREEEAAACYRKLLEIDPKHRQGRINYGAILRNAGRIEEAIALWSTIDPEDPTFAERDYNIGFARLMLGDWSDWSGMERRLDLPGWSRPAATEGKPLWSGAADPALTLLVHWEQGLGDTVQFVRLVAPLLERVGRVVLVVQPALKPLLGPAVALLDPKGRIDLRADGEPLPAFGAYLPLLSIPHRIGLTKADLRPARPYLKVEPQRVEQWRTRLAEIEAAAGIAGRPFRIGLVWQGNPTAPAERKRSFPLKAYAGLADLPNVVFYPLQKGPGREQVADPPKGMKLLNLGADFDAGPGAFLDTVAVSASLDLVISSDTSVAHVVAAAGRPVFTVLSPVPDWRWGGSGETSPFYPTMRLFRQTLEGGPAEAVARAKEAVGPLLALRARLAREPQDGRPPPIELGLSRHADGRYAEAADAYRKRLSAEPDDPVALNLLAMALFEGGQRSRSACEEALPLAQRAVAVAPTYADGFANLAVLLKAVGRLSEAEQALNQALALQPAHAAALTNLVGILVGRGEPEEAVRMTASLAERNSRDPGVWKAQAAALKAAGRAAQAASAYRIAAALARGDAGVRLELGVVLDEAGDAAGARAAWLEAIAIRPQEALPYSNLGVLERRAGMPTLAIWYYRQALERNPDHAETWTNLGTALFELGRVEAARVAFSRAIALRPDYADAHMALGMALLVDGRYEEGLAEYEWRLKTPRLKLDAGLPAWTGGLDVAGRTLLLVAEQGFGDSIQFIRYARLLKQAGARVLVGTRARLARLLAAADGVDGIVVDGSRIPPIDGALPVMSLPHLFGTTVETIPADTPYLKADPERVRRWAAKLAEGDGFRIGIIWQGNPDPAVDSGRSMPLAALAPLAAIPGVRLIALQKGFGSEQVHTLRGRFTVETLGADFDEGPDGFLDTAAVMMNCDLIVSTDTATLHLAGALGRPLFALLKANAEWRFLRGRGDSPWYPTARLYRQRAADETAPDPWADAVERMARDVAAVVAGDRSRLFSRERPVRVADPQPLANPDRAFQVAAEVHKAGQVDQARRLYAEILADHPGHAEAVHMMGAAALQKLAYPESLIFLEAARRLGLDSAEFGTNLAVAYRRTGRVDEAERMLRDILAERPKTPEALVNLGTLLVDTDRPEEAVPLLEQAAVLRPWMAEVHRAMGNALKEMDRPAEALPHFDRALRLAPTNADLKVDRAHARLSVGDLPGGFSDYEARWKGTEMVPRSFTMPLWDGRAFEGRTLLVHGEQGLGDHIQFARFLPMVVRRGGSVILEVREPLIPLISGMDFGGAVRFVVQGGPVPDHDMQVPMMSLPFLLGITLDTLPAQVPYLHAEPARVERWRMLAGDGRGPLIGLAWQGNPRARADRGRSPPLADLAPILKLRGVRFVALQKEHGLDQLADSPHRGRIILPGDGFDSGPGAFLDTAAVMTLCDGIVTSDTAVAHLAGALGRPTYLMLKHAADWRWMVGRDTSPWYPTMRLFRQTRRGDWAGVAEAVAAALAAKGGGA